MSMSNEVYDRFKNALEAVAGKCYRTTKAELGNAVINALKEYGLNECVIAETPILQEAGVLDVVKGSGMEAWADHVRLRTETVKGGICEAQYAIADLGSIVQVGNDVDGRIMGCLPELMVAVIKGSNIIAEWDEFFDTIGALPEHPNFIGIVTGPSRTSDIEMVSVVGVHGPLNLTAIVVEDV